MALVVGSLAFRSAAYNVPLGGALFALEVLRGVLALRLVLPAVTASLIATMIAWVAIPNAPTYNIPEFPNSASIVYWAVLAGPVAGVVSVGYVRAIQEADRLRPKGAWRLMIPAMVFSVLGATSIWFPQLLAARLTEVL